MTHLKLSLPLLGLIASGLLGCSTTPTGPFVKNVSTDSKGNLAVEKCTMEVDRWSSNLQAKDCSTEHVALHHKTKKPIA